MGRDGEKWLRGDFKARGNSWWLDLTGFLLKAAQDKSAATLMGGRMRVLIRYQEWFDTEDEGWEFSLNWLIRIPAKPGTSRPSPRWCLVGRKTQDPDSLYPVEKPLGHYSNQNRQCWHIDDHSFYRIGSPKCLQKHDQPASDKEAEVIQCRKYSLLNKWYWSPTKNNSKNQNWW